MKIKYISITLLLLLMSVISCDKNFEEININPYFWPLRLQASTSGEAIYTVE